MSKPGLSEIGHPRWCNAREPNPGMSFFVSRVCDLPPGHEADHWEEGLGSWADAREPVDSGSTPSGD